MISRARCRGKCKAVTLHHICWGGDGVYFTCTKCGEQFKTEPAPVPEGTPTAPKERAIEFLSGCPNCGEEPEEWNTMMEEPCRGCGKTLMCNLREDENGVKHWSFDYAFEGDTPEGTPRG